MGLAAAFVFSLNWRAVLAVLAIAVSAGYTLVAGAAAGGLKNAQDIVGEQLAQSQWVVSRPDGSGFSRDEVPGGPVSAVAVVEAGGTTYFVLRGGSFAQPAPGRVTAEPAAGFRVGQALVVAGVSVAVDERGVTPGVLPTWIGVDEGTFRSLGGPPPPTVHLAAYADLDAADQLALARSGFQLHGAPAAFAFYTQGAQEIVSVLRVTAAASAVVVGFLTGTLVRLELNAHRTSFATLQLFAGARRVQTLLALRVGVLLAGGLGAAWGLTTAALFLLQRGGAPNLALSSSYLAWALPVVAAGGALGVVWSIRRLGRPLAIRDIAGAGSGRSGIAGRRFLFASWRMVVPLSVSALVLAGSLGVSFGVIQMPNQIFGVASGTVVANLDGNPLRGAVPAFFGEHLDEIEGYRASSPEIFGPTVIDGKPAIVRGVNWTRLAKLDGARVVEGREPQAFGEAVFGQGLARRLGASVGDSYWVPASYHAGLVKITVVGLAKAPGILSDEALVTLPTGRALTGLQADEVNIARLSLNESFVRRGGTFPPIPTGVVVTHLDLRPSVPVANQTAEVRVHLLNFAKDGRSHPLTLSVNGQPEAERTVGISGFSARVEPFTFRVPASGLLTLRVNPTVVVETEDPAYTIEAPPIVASDSAFTIRVAQRDGRPAGGVAVELDGFRGPADSTGAVEASSGTLGNRTILVTGTEGRAARSVLVVRAEDLDRARLHWHGLDGPGRAPVGSWTGTATVENLGGATFDGPLPVPLDGNTTNATQVTIPPGVTQRVPITMGFGLGAHRIGPPGAELAVDVFDPLAEPTAPPPPQPGSDGQSEVERLLDQRRAQTPPAVGSSGDATIGFLGDTYENLNAAITVITLASFLHAALIVFITLRREMEERGANIGTLAALGASRGAIRARCVVEYAVVGAGAALGGTLLGLLLAWAAAEGGYLHGFGHSLGPHADPIFGLRIAAASLATTLAAAAISVDAVRNQNLRRLLAAGPSRTARPPLESLIGKP